MPTHPLDKDWRSTRTGARQGPALDKDWRQSLREDREAYILAGEHGYTEARCGEHATGMAENITSCAVFLATLVGAT